MKISKQKHFLKRSLGVLFVLFLLLAPFSISVNLDAPSPVLSVETRVAHAEVWGIFSGPGEFLGQVIFKIASVITYAGGQLLEISIKHLVIGFGPMINDSGLGVTINTVWELVRDIANLLFIFGFIYLGIRTIIDYESSFTKKMLAQLIISALLINFSLFITKVVIEFSNLIANGIYSKLIAGDGGGSITGEIMSILGIASWYSPVGGEVLANLTSGGELWFFIMASIFLIITGFVFLNGAMMLISRFVGLIFIMMFSPILFAARIFPQTEKYAKDMWGKLISYSFYAPAYIFLILVSILVLKSTTQVFTQSGKGYSETFTEDAFGTAGSIDAFGIVLNFVVAIIVIQTAASLAKKFGLVGSELAIKITDGTKKFIRRNTADRLGNVGLRWGSSQLRKFEYGKSGERHEHTRRTFAGKLGASRFGEIAKVLPGVLAGVQLGGEKFKDDLKARGAKLSGKRNSQMKRMLDTIMMRGAGRLNELDFMAIVNAFESKGDTDELDPHIIKKATDMMEKHGLGTTKFFRLRPDVGDTERYDKKGNVVKKGDEGYDVAISDIGRRVQRTKKALDVKNWHPRIATNTSENRGGWAKEPGKRDAQIKELGDSIVQFGNGEMIAELGRNKNAVTMAFEKALLAKKEINGSRDAEVVARYYDNLAEKAERIAKDDDMKQRALSAAAYFRSSTGSHMFGLIPSPQARGGGGNSSGGGRVSEPRRTTNSGGNRAIEVKADIDGNRAPTNPSSNNNIEADLAEDILRQEEDILRQEQDEFDENK